MTYTFTPRLLKLFSIIFLHSFCIVVMNIVITRGYEEILIYW